MCVGNGFVFFGGDCAESFSEFDVDHIRDTFRVMLQMSIIMTFAGGKHVTKIGRTAGQFAKPRSQPTETIDGVTLPCYRGDIINDIPFTVDARTPDPTRMLKAYAQSAQTINILRAFSTGGYANLNTLHDWNLDFISKTQFESKYRNTIKNIESSLHFMNALGINTNDNSLFTNTNFYTAHECLLLHYEEALTRVDSTTGRYYDCSAHMLWVGERTRQPGQAHLEFVSGIHNPIGVKISDKATPNEVLTLINTLNPNNIPGKLTLIVRMGVHNLHSKLPNIIKAVQSEGKAVVWVCDPVHANTYKTHTGFKTRNFNDILQEIQLFFDIHDTLNTHAGGIHLEMTGADVTECIGGTVNGITMEQLPTNYKTLCDPRLNAMQSLELAFHICEYMKK